MILLIYSALTIFQPFINFVNKVSETLASVLYFIIRSRLAFKHRIQLFVLLASQGLCVQRVRKNVI